ncbi:MAG: hypothetical protein C5B54_10690, partial [Acidobacteria bacterium]
MSIKRLLLPCFMLLLLAGITWAQVTTGSMKGVITDPDGKPVPGATVTISSSALLGGTRTAYTNDTGTFRFPSLPIGTYSVQVNLEGFEKVEVSKVIVSLAQTANVPLTMKMATRAEEMNIIGEAPLIDVTQSGLSTNIPSEIIENVPNQRFFYNIIQTAPGVTADYTDNNTDRVIAFGSNEQSNSWNIDGLETTAPETGTTWLYQAPDSIDEIQIIGVGAPAEYGNHMGAVFNVVTKKGGNTFHGSANYYWQNQSLTNSNVTLPVCNDSLANGAPCVSPDIYALDHDSASYHRDQYHDLSATLGGPILHDKLWFFASVQNQRDAATQAGNLPVFLTPLREDSYDVRVSGMASKKNEWTGFWHWEKWLCCLVPSPYEANSELYTEEAPNDSWGGNWTSTLSNNLLFEVRYAGWTTHDLHKSQTGAQVGPFLDYSPPSGPYYYSGGVQYPFDYATSRHQLNGKVTYYAENFLKTQHEFRFGVQWSRGNADTLTAAGFNGYYDYHTNYGYYGSTYLGLYRAFQEPYHYGAITHDLGTFMDDTVTVNSRLTLNLGVRFDHNTGDVPAYSNIKVGTPSITEVGNFVDAGTSTPGFHVMTWNKVSPRLGFSYQIAKGGKSVVNGSFGVYYDHNVSGDWDGGEPSITPFSVFHYNPATKQFDIPYYTVSSSQFGVDPNIRPPRTLQYAAGYDQQLSPSIAVGAQYVYKTTKDLIGWEILGGQWTPLPYTDPFTGTQYTLLDGDPSLAQYYKGNGPGDFCNHIVGGGTASVCNQDLSSYHQTYHGVVLTFTKRFNNKWAMNASYTWSQSKGLIPTPQSQDQFNPPYGSTAGQNPNYYLNGYHVLPGDRPSMFRIQSFFHNLPLGMEAAANVDISSGKPIIRRAEPSLSGLGNSTVIMQDGIRLKAIQTVDLTLGRMFHLGKRVQANLQGTIYNVLNADNEIHIASTILDPGQQFTPDIWQS